jgi:hypothetical protein
MMIKEESEILNKKLRAELKTAKMKKKDKYELPYFECLQQSTAFNTFGFRLITMTACLKCKHVQRKLSFHMDLPLPIRYSKDPGVLAAPIVSNFFKDKTGMSMAAVVEKANEQSCLKSLFSCCFRKSANDMYMKEEPERTNQQG